MALSLADHILKHQDTNKEGELLRQFQMLDMDGDGVISPKELETFFKHSKYENSVADLLRRADLDHDDRISYREVLVLALERVSWNVPLRREDLSRRVGLSSSDVDIVQQRVQQQQRDSRRSPSRTSPRTNRNIQDAARRSSRRKQQQSIELTAKQILQEANDLLVAYERAERSHRLGRYRASLMQRSKSVTQQCNNLLKYRNKMKPELYNSIVRIKHQVSQLFY